MQFFAIQNNSNFKDFYYTLTIFIYIKIFILLKYNIYSRIFKIQSLKIRKKKYYSKINFPCIESIAFFWIVNNTSNNLSQQQTQRPNSHLYATQRLLNLLQSKLYSKKQNLFCKKTKYKKKYKNCN